MDAVNTPCIPGAVKYLLKLYDGTDDFGGQIGSLLSRN